MKPLPRPGDLLRSESGQTYRYICFDGRFHRVRGTLSGREYPMYPAQLQEMTPTDTEAREPTWEQDIAAIEAA